MPPGDRPDFQRRVLEEVRSIPYVQSAALSTHIPLVGASWSFAVNVTTPRGERNGDSRFTYISPQYFRTMDTPVLQGRDFDDSDTTSSVKVVIVNQTFVRRYILTPNPIGTIVRTIAEPVSLQRSIKWSVSLRIRSTQVCAMTCLRSRSCLLLRTRNRQGL